MTLGCQLDGVSQSSPLFAPIVQSPIMQGNTLPLKIFADKSFYKEHPNTEITLTGILRTSTVRLGPNTRDMPLRLETSQENLSVYVTQREEELLLPFVNQEIKVIGKRIDQRQSGYGFEIWIAWIIPNRE
ncbi:hypothetical protein CLI64_04975 [Nostoc sp. CENA543]|nr:hypothetical protein CLI64_04975 [Nostoc sp. CENA543]